MSRLPAAGPLAAAALALGLVAGTGCGSSPAKLSQATTTSTSQRAGTHGAAEASRPPGDVGARIKRRTQLRAEPGGRLIARLGRKTTFGSPQILAVVKQRGDWLGVIAPQAGNGRIGWIPAANATLVGEPVRIVVDRSARRLSVLDSGTGRVEWTMKVGIGAPATPTPVGEFAVTDGLHGGNPAYGCCILALSARQPHLAQGWTGGDRIAVHGTSAPATIGAATSNGCMHATDADLRRLMRTATLGSRVFIRA